MRENSIFNNPPKTRFVSHLPDLITEEDYLVSSEQKKIRVRINLNNEGVDILGDSIYAYIVEELMAQLGADEIERILCG
ncbi:radical SAM-modified peptide, FtsH ternary system-associated [Nostoc sp.]|uniref:radical SAM-modified peptide, FtsH ternary system-associated n=1 Tax=Nostoc sp. TaxID=1180 RepID=UPI002FFBA894